MDHKKTTDEGKTDFKEKIDKQNEKFRSPGWRGLPSTSAFRAINFELYAKPVNILWLYDQLGKYLSLSLSLSLSLGGFISNFL